MRWNHVIVTSLSVVGIGLLPLASRLLADQVGAWHEDPRRPSGAMTEGASSSTADAWHVDARRPSAFMAGNASQSTVEPWRHDVRRPDHLTGEPDNSRVTPWRVDDRRPANWPKRGAAAQTSAPTDSDHDGVPDSQDRCPGTAYGVRVDAYGCPLDSDQDGVPDDRDRCPDTPRGTRVDRDGCPMSTQETQLLDTGKLSLENVYFDLDKATIKPESYPALDEVGKILAKWPELKIEIGGHTDNTGTDEYNHDLSQSRAQAVLEYLTSKFSLRKDQYSAKGYGETRPVASNDTKEGRAKNRRVEFTVQNREVLRK
jgi:outer membrane protein OmpA-like peptidoglycan-associated protein